MVQSLIHDVAVAGPATHALVIGVGAYPHLNGGTEKRTDQHDGMEQLTSPPISARAFASWLMSEFHHPDKPLASVALLVSGANPAPFIDPTDATKSVVVSSATSENVEDAVRAFFARGNENAANQLIFTSAAMVLLKEPIPRCSFPTMAVTNSTRSKAPSIFGFCVWE